MRESVCIVLNEREGPKARAAEALQRLLHEHAITVSRIEIVDKIEHILAERAPPILVLDYLLGDFSTGLDVVQRLNELPIERRPSVFFLTDEPSVQVAVDAMRLGALNYFELDHPQSLGKLTREIIAALAALQFNQSTNSSSERSGNPRLRRPADLVATAAITQALVTQTNVVLRKPTPLIIILGPSGSGKRTLARLIQSNRPHESVLREISLRTCSESAEDITNLSGRSFGPRLGHNLSLIITDGEEEDGEFLELLIGHAKKIWPDWGAHTNHSFFTFCTTSPETARAWKRSFPECEFLEIPPLHKRVDDIPALAQRFVSEASDISGQKVRALDSTTLRWLAARAWPGNVRQLRGVLIDSIIAWGGGSDSADFERLREVIESRAALWEEESTALGAHEGQPLSALGGALLINAYRGRPRAAAALLGCSVQELDRALSEHKPDQVRQR